MKTPVIYISIAAAALGVGITGGIIAKRMSGEIVDYGDVDANALELDGQSMLDKYESYKGNSVETAFTAPELVVAGLQKYRSCEHSYSVGGGVAATIVNQSVRNFQIRNGDDYFEESISKSSMVNFANRMTQHTKEGNITLYKGSAPTDDTGSYSGESKEYEPSAYKELLGRTLDEMFIYIISNVTTKDGKIERDGDKYVITLDLDPDFSTYRYKFQMKNISGLDELPTFSYVKLTFTFDKDMWLEKLHVDESYRAKMGVSVTITNTIDYYYFPNQEMEIPTLDTQLDYSLGGKIK